MKRRFIALFLALALVMCVNGSVLAQGHVVNAGGGVVVPMGMIGLSSGLTKVSGRTYDVWAAARAFTPENITVGFALYKVVNKTEIYITAGSNSGYGYLVEACDTVTLAAGTYRLYAFFEGETQSNGTLKTYTVN